MLRRGAGRGWLWLLPLPSSLSIRSLVLACKGLPVDSSCARSPPPLSQRHQLLPYLNFSGKTSPSSSALPLGAACSVCFRSQIFLVFSGWSFLWLQGPSLPMNEQHTCAQPQSRGGQIVALQILLCLSSSLCFALHLFGKFLFLASTRW